MESGGDDAKQVMSHFNYGSRHNTSINQQISVPHFQIFLRVYLLIFVRAQLTANPARDQQGGPGSRNYQPQERE
jgi:hypothetical protein